MSIRKSGKIDELKMRVKGWFDDPNQESDGGLGFHKSLETKVIRANPQPPKEGE